MREQIVKFGILSFWGVASEVKQHGACQYLRLVG